MTSRSKGKRTSARFDSASIANKKLTLLAIVAVAFIASCGGQEPPKTPKERRALPGDIGLTLDEAVPTMEGGAYQLAGHSVYYLHGDTATEVVPAGDSLERAAFYRGALGGDITPVSGGGAYMTTLAYGLWRLSGSIAQRVRRDSTAAGNEKRALGTREQRMFALFSYELGLRRKAQDAAAETDNSDDGS